MSVILAAVGDILIDRVNPGTTFDELAPVLDAADIVFGNFEGVSLQIRRNLFLVRRRLRL